MRDKRAVISFLIVAAVLLSIVPTVNLYEAYKTRTPLKDLLTDSTRLFRTDRVETFLNKTIYTVFNLSLHPGYVLAGKEGFLFLGNNFSRIIDKTEGTFAYRMSDVHRWSRRLLALQSWYEKQGIAFVFVVAPNKHTLYHDKLPWFVRYDANASLTDLLVKKARQEGVHIINLKDRLTARKKERLLYHKTDTHWNRYGAYEGYRATMAYLNRLLPRPLQTVTVRLERIAVSKGGDLTRFLRLEKAMKFDEEAYRFVFDVPAPKCYGEIDRTYRILPCKHRTLKRFNRYSHNPDAPNPQRLLYMCDSFGLHNTALYERTFTHVYRLHLAYIHGKTLSDFIRRARPDVVVYQIVERDLYNEVMLESL